ncbi:hypothetical protein SAMN05216274_10693 [Cryobacterium levicorallinum]|uniref:Secreted protein n=1 Tax=Cryobacterium levicorallinum TaxID=995038 RepID=A0ABY1ED34_9MICO|nr:hypothetical protein SAMN05216274_10693 [Cryobacterium levicorallinum]
MDARRTFSVIGVVLVEIALVGAALTGWAVAQPQQPEVTPNAPSSSAPSSQHVVVAGAASRHRRKQNIGRARATLNRWQCEF